MASEWIKWTKGLCRKPEVVTLSSRFERDRFSIAARLMCVWEWTDEVTNDGKVLGVDLAFIDELAGIKGFGEGMISVGWLALVDGGVEFTNYVANNGNTGKSRAQAQKRQNMSRFKRDKSVTESVTREEKRREEGNTNTPSSASPKDSGLVKAATAWLETIYLAYPRKVEKRAALKAIAAAVKRIKDQDDAVGFLLDRVTAYAKAVKGQDPQYIPYPSTWFNSGRYEDDETQWQRTGNHRAGTPQIGRIDAAPDKYAGVGVTINVDPPAQHTFSGGLETDAW